MTFATRAAPLVALALVTGLGGCITLFPKEKPDELYRFGDDIHAAPAAGPGFTVRDAGVSFDQAAAGDLILTSDGHHVAYVSGGRWAAPASVMFSAAVQRGFGRSGGAARLLEAGDAGNAQYTLHLVVGHFEARYQNGPTGAPTVIISMRATLTRNADPTHAVTEPIDASAPATANRIGDIAEAFNQATDEAVGKLVAWVDQTGESDGAGEAKTGA